MIDHVKSKHEKRRISCPLQCGKSFAQRAGLSAHKRKYCRNRHLVTVEVPNFKIFYTIEVPVQQQEVTTSNNVQVTTSQDIEKIINDDTNATKEPEVEPGAFDLSAKDKVEQQQQKEDQSIDYNFEDLLDKVLNENKYHT